MLLIMKTANGMLLLCAITTLVTAACSHGPEGGGEPVAGPEGQQNQSSEASELARNENPDQGEEPTIRNGVDVNRLRLPDMEELPSERELASKAKPDNKGGGVIARPPLKDN